MRRTLAVLLLAAPLIAGGCATDDAAEPATTPPVSVAVTTTSAPTSTTAVGSTEPVVKEVLAELVDPPGADGRTLTLMRYTIAAGAQLAPHIHPGVQLASIEAGTLTYTVDSGTVDVRRSDGTTEPLTAPITTELRPGDSVTELGEAVHFGGNDTDEPIVILATLLTITGEDLAVVVDPPPGG